MSSTMSDPSTWPDPAEDPSAALPAREAPEGSQVDGWCAELVDRVRPGGFAPAPARETALIAGRYRLLHRLGRGGVGEIWCAEHVGIRKEVAVKLLRDELAADPLVRRRFLREGRLAAAVRHPGVVDILDVGETEDGLVYLVMERLAGRTLSEEVEWAGPLPWSRARAVLIQLAEALACAHERGVVHRDLKPSNVMLVGTRDDGSDRCKLIDFGMARGLLRADESTELTRTGVVLGSPAYMSPEQFRGEEADARSDVYSLGCVAYFVLTGQRPFLGATPAELMYQHLMLPLPRVRGLGLPASVEAELRRWLDRACHKRPEQRFAGMAAMLAALRELGARSPWRRFVPLAASAAVMLGLGVAALEVSREDVDAPNLPPASASDSGEDREPVAVVAPPRCGDGRVDADEQCDDGNTAPADGCEPDCSDSEIVDLRAANSYTCALTRSGHVRCWGQQGPHLAQPAHAGHIGDDERPCDVPPVDLGPRRARQLGLEFLAPHVCVVLDDDTARCWGSDASEQLGLGPGVTHWGDAPDEIPARLPPLALPPVRTITANESGTCALAGDPERPGVYCWGSNSHGQLGRGDTEPRTEPPAEPIDLGDVGVRELSLGITNVCARLDHGTVRCWGGNRNLHLGTGWPVNRYAGDGVGDGARGRTPNTPDLDVEGLAGFDVAAVRMNGGWACVLSLAGEVRCWGGNDDGALGERFDRIAACDEGSHGVGCLVPRPILAVDLGDLDGARVVDLQMGRKRACVLDDAGRVRCWGWGIRGSLGYGPLLRDTTGHWSIGHHLTPAEAYAAMGNGGVVDVGDLDHDGQIDRVAKIALGYSHTCVLAVDGTVRCWGSNSEGQLGYGTTEDIGDDETPGDYYAAHACGAVPVFAGHGC
ncbi:protein kinase domain-containing protein [Nannocystis punicea]|uniref:Protein kinase n=1 Tax=Nannocystis punicea TaxID=2995304 RepID=A0ABY7HJ62_9BACT|nr:protein kinase [Nannocystis poenicansa]WAS99375.1 protein kinase [Nannocystis poenicansa]